MYARWVFTLSMLALLPNLSGCLFGGERGGPTRQSPVVGRCEGIYVAQPGDTLRSVAMRFNCDAQALIQRNGLFEPYILTPGQTLALGGDAAKSLGSQNQASLLVEEVPPQSEPIDKVSSADPHWIWPSQGNVSKGFGQGGGSRKGIEITGQAGQPVMAAAAGKVVYRGTGIKGYGELVIIKHDNGYLSAYGYNEGVTVSEGQSVSAGQVIGHMGKDNESRPGLHFEIRKDGTSVDPLLYLPKH